MPLRREEHMYPQFTISDSYSSEEDSVNAHTVDIFSQGTVRNRHTTNQSDRIHGVMPVEHEENLGSSTEGDSDDEETRILSGRGLRSVSPESRADEEARIRKYGNLDESQRCMVDNSSADVQSIIPAFSRSEGLSQMDPNECDLRGFMNIDALSSALKYKGLSEHTREALLAAPIAMVTKASWRARYAENCQACLGIASTGFAGLSHEDQPLIKRRFNLELNDNAKAQNTLKCQLEDPSLLPSATPKLSNEGNELYDLNIASLIATQLLELGFDLPKDIPPSMLNLLSPKTRPHARDHWELISYAYAYSHPPSLKNERLETERANRLELFAGWPTWRERGSRADWLADQIMTVDLRNMACWSTK